MNKQDLEINEGLVGVQEDAAAPEEFKETQKQLSQMEALRASLRKEINFYSSTCNKLSNDLIGLRNELDREKMRADSERSKRLKLEEIQANSVSSFAGSDLDDSFLKGGNAKKDPLPAPATFGDNPELYLNYIYSKALSNRIMDKKGNNLVSVF